MILTPSVPSLVERPTELKHSSIEVAMSDPIALWYAEHANFASLLRFLERQLDVLSKGEARPTMN